MSRFFVFIAALTALHGPWLRGSDISGQITLDPKSFRKTLSPGIYDLRGMSVSTEAHKPAGAGRFGRIAVWLESDELGSAAPISATMRQCELRLEPELIIVPTGSRVSFPNLDPIFHNIFSLSHTQSFDLGYYSEGKTREVAFPKAGIIQIYCHIHPEMYGVIVVTSSRWTAKPSADGSFSWANVLPGKYKLIAWQRSAGLVHTNITVPPTGTVHVKLRLPEDSQD